MGLENNMQEFWKLLNFPLVILSLFIIRLLITGASIGDSVVLLGVAALYGFYYHTESKKQPDINKEFKDKFIQLQTEIENLRHAQNTIKIASQIKPATPVRF